MKKLLLPLITPPYPYQRTALFGFNCFLNTKNQTINTPLFKLKTQPYTLVKYIGVGLTTSCA